MNPEPKKEKFRLKMVRVGSLESTAVSAGELGDESPHPEIVNALMLLRPPVISEASESRTFRVLANHATVAAARASGLTRTPIPCILVIDGKLIAEEWGLLEEHLQPLIFGAPIRRQNQARQALRLANRREWASPRPQRDVLKDFVDRRRPEERGS